MASMTDVVNKWGPALTKLAKEGDLTEFRALFSDEDVLVVLQANGEEAEFTVGESDKATLSWNEFKELTCKDMKEQDYLKTEAQILGVLANRAIVESGRFNSAGELYMESYSLITFDAAGKIICVESFADANMANLTAAVAK